MEARKRLKPSVPDSIKAEVEAGARLLIGDVLKPRHVLPPEPDSDLNYIIDISAEWHRSFFYFRATYACPHPNAISRTFEANFARMEYLRNGKFALSYLRHTGKWFQIRDGLTAEECLTSIGNDPWFLP